MKIDSTSGRSGLDPLPRARTTNSGRALPGSTESGSVPTHSASHGEIPRNVPPKTSARTSPQRSLDFVAMVKKLMGSAELEPSSGAARKSSRHVDVSG